MADGVVVCDRHGTIVYASERLALLLGYRPDELVCQPLETIVPDRLAARHGALRREYVESPATRPMGVGLELAARHRSGRDVPVEVGLSSFGAGSETRVVAVVRDISERLALEREAASQAVLYSTIVGSVSDLLYVTDAALRVTFANARALAAACRGAVVGERLPIERPGLRREIEAMIAGGESAEGVEFDARLSHFTDVEAWHHVRVAPLRGSGGDIVGTVVSASNISERRRSEATRRSLERDLFQARKMEALGRLARGVAHDFNNILQAVGGTAALALERADGQLREDLETIIASAAQGRELTSQLVTFGRPDSGPPELLDLHRELAEFVPVLRRLVSERVEVRIECPPDVAGVRVSRVHIEQILMNLVVNAGEAIGGDGEVTVRVSDTRARLRPESPPHVEEEAVAIAVIDTGHGLSEDTLASLFDPFYTTKPGGTGIGLSIVYQLVGQAGGRISARSLAPAGAEFLVLLPAVRPPHPSAPCPGV